MHSAPASNFPGTFAILLLPVCLLGFLSALGGHVPCLQSAHWAPALPRTGSQPGAPPSLSLYHRRSYSLDSVCKFSLGVNFWEANALFVAVLCTAREGRGC